MEFTNISEAEGFFILKKVTNIPMVARVLPDMGLRLIIGNVKDVKITERNGFVHYEPKGDHTIAIDNGWTLFGDKHEHHNTELLALKDEENIEKILLNSKIIGINFVKKFKVISFVFDIGLEISITNPGDDGLYFKYYSNSDLSENRIIGLNKDFNFVAITREDTLIA